MAQPQQTSFAVKNSDGARVEVQLQGAHITSWSTADGLRPLYLSPAAVFAPGKAIRGGIPVCWPQFSDLGPLKTAHGIARTRLWRVDQASVANGSAAFELGVGPGDDDAPDVHALVRLCVECGGSTLKVSLSAKNLRSDAPLTFTTALHSYFGVAVDTLTIRGALDQCQFADNLAGRVMCPAEPIRTIDREVDRIYENVPGEVVLTDAATNMEIRVASENMPDSVLWNPWREKAARLVDLPDDGYKHFVCVEHGAILRPVTIAPGASWSGSQTADARVVAQGSSL